jgi:hypothetical protein
MKQIITSFSLFLVACATLINTGVTQCAITNGPNHYDALQMCKTQTLRHLRPDLEILALIAPTSTDNMTHFVTQTSPRGFGAASAIPDTVSRHS